MSFDFKNDGIVRDRLPRDLLVYQWSYEDLFPIPETFQLMNTQTGRPVTFNVIYRVSRGTFQYVVGDYDDQYMVVEMQPDGDVAIIQSAEGAQRIFDASIDADEIRMDNGDALHEDRSHFFMAGRGGITYEVRMKAIIEFEGQWFTILEAWNNPEESLTYRFSNDEVGPAYMTPETDERVIRGVVHEYFGMMDSAYSTGGDHFQSYDNDDSDLFE